MLKTQIKERYDLVVEGIEMKVLGTITEISSEPLDKIGKGCEALHILFQFAYNKIKFSIRSFLISFKSNLYICRFSIRGYPCNLKLYSYYG